MAHLGLVPCWIVLAAVANLVMAMDVGGLGAKWEAQQGIRDRIRKERKLCLHPLSQRYCEPTRPNSVTNAMVLRPALEILKDTPGWKLPHIEPLQAEIYQLFQRVGTPSRISTSTRRPWKSRSCLDSSKGGAPGVRSRRPVSFSKQ